MGGDGSGPYERGGGGDGLKLELNYFYYFLKHRVLILS